MIQNINSIAELNIAHNQDLLILLDVDQTIINPHNFIADPQFRYFKIFDVLKESDLSESLPRGYVNRILGVFRSNRDEVLIEQDWIKFVHHAQSQGHIVMALTSFNTGRMDYMENLAEEWRYNILRDLGILFSGHDKVEKLSDDVVDYVINFRGIIQTGKYSKATSLDLYFKSIKEHPKQIIFIDDRKEKLEEVSVVAQDYNIGYFPYLYQGVKNFKIADYNEADAVKQLEVLLKYGELLSNHEIGSYQMPQNALISDELFNIILQKVLS